MLTNNIARAQVRERVRALDLPRRRVRHVLVRIVNLVERDIDNLEQKLRIWVLPPGRALGHVVPVDDDAFEVLDPEDALVLQQEVRDCCADWRAYESALVNVGEGRSQGAVSRLPRSASAPSSSIDNSRPGQYGSVVMPWLLMILAISGRVSSFLT